MIINRNLSNVLFKRAVGCDKDTAGPLPKSLHRKTTKQNHSDNKLAAAVTSKLEAGNFRAASRILCSDDKPAADNAVTYDALQEDIQLLWIIAGLCAIPEATLGSNHDRYHQKIWIERNDHFLSDPLEDRTAYQLNIFVTYYLTQLTISYARPSQIQSIFC